MNNQQNSADTPFSVKTIIGPMMAVIVGMIMVILDSTVVNVALPGITDYFKSDLTKMQWTITGYTLALSAVIPLAGWMSDRFGAKKIFLLTILFFTIGSVLCSVAQTPEQLILFRVIQGIGGGMVAPIGMAIIFRLAPPEKIGSIMGMLGIPMLLAPALGPVISGWFVEYSTWHWVFLINLPIGIIALIIGAKFLPNFESKSVPALDKLGIIIAPIAFSMLAYGVSQSSTSWTSRETLTGLIVGGVALLLFIFVELRLKQPLLELRVFKSSDFVRSILITWIMQIALFGSFLIVPLFLQTVKQYGAFETGLIMLPQAVASALMMPIGGKMYDKVGARPMALVGLTIITTSLFIFSKISVDSSNTFIMLTLAMMGAGMGLSMMPINTHVLQSAPRHLVSRVTPLTAAAQQVMVSFAVAGMAGFLTSSTKDYMAKTTNPLNAMISAFGDTFLLAAGIALAGALLAIILRKPKVQEADASKEELDESKSSMMVGH
ncbi:DHA2 family efflux MFS transporter permease subunit [Bacillus sp. AFS055030]|uniref:DHA2 family efflux MFS transporter permease subunit n=1 Tax=Bacillus sp. AFS055030 TaxID=2033507 RepID=UPI000BFC951C|nr:DHA2 family efflux MFS transporter permease subunit [Bacillus sp. AFS055030]PGL73484.1 MFS transporter [Bacillus sp. AFS055030]